MNPPQPETDNTPKTKHPLYKTWINIRQRCTNPNFPQWKDYGGRGIVVCDRWDSFTNFITDMGERPEGYTLDRINNDGNYEPSNCRWASRSTQQLNSRMRVNNKSGLKGISQHGGKWGVQSYVCGKKYSFGAYNTAEEAHYVYERVNKMAQDLTLKVEKELLEAEEKAYIWAHDNQFKKDFHRQLDDRIDELKSNKLKTQ